MPKSDVAIVSCYETRYERHGTRTVYEYAAEAAVGAMAAAGIEKEQVDGLAVTASSVGAGDPFWSGRVNEYLGLQTRWLDCCDHGGGGPLGAVARSIMAIRAGYVHCVLVVAGDTMTPREHRAHRDHPGSYRPEFEAPYGPIGPPGLFGLIAHRYAHERGIDVDDLIRAMGRVAIAQRAQACLNPQALLRTPLTYEDYLATRVIADPLRLVDCVMPCSGGAALVVAGEPLISAAGTKPVFMSSYAEMHNWQGASPLPDVVSTGFSVSGREVLERAGLTPDDVDMFQPYDDFTVAVLMQLEDIGFCRPGEAARFVHETDLSNQGRLPLNTGGGQLSVGQPGLVGGMVNLIEAVRQLRGEAGDRQVPHARNALVTGIGIVPLIRNWHCSAAAVLEV